MVYNISIMDALMVSWLSLWKMDMATQVQILDEAVCISYSANTIVKGMNPTILPPLMCK